MQTVSNNQTYLTLNNLARDIAQKAAMPKEFDSVFDAYDAREFLINLIRELQYEIDNQ